MLISCTSASYPPSPSITTGPRRPAAVRHRRRGVPRPPRGPAGSAILRDVDLRGIALCVVSGIGFGTTGVLSALAHRAGVALLVLLALRFALASSMLAAASAATGRLRTVWTRDARMPFLVGLLLSS